MNHIILITSVLLGVNILLFLIRRGLLALASKTKGKLDDKLVPAGMKLIKVGVWAAAIIFVAQNLGLNMSAAYAGLGVITIAVSQSFAGTAKSVVSDVIAGIQMAFAPPFKLHENVSIGKVEGKVFGVTLTHTAIQRDDGRLLCIPNSRVVSSTIGKEIHETK